MSEHVERNIVGVPLRNGEQLTFNPPVSVWEALRAKREAEKKKR